MNSYQKKEHLTEEVRFAREAYHRTALNIKKEAGLSSKTLTIMHKYVGFAIKYAKRHNISIKPFIEQRKTISNIIGQRALTKARS